MTTDEQFNQLQERIKSLEQQVKDLEDKNENLAVRLSDAEDAIWELEDRIDIEEYGDIDPEEEQRKLEEIDFFVFNNCPNLRSIVIPASVKTIGKAFCNNCPSLKTATFLCSCPENLAGAFSGCPVLEEIIVPESEVEKYKTAMPDLTDKIHC